MRLLICLLLAGTLHVKGQNKIVIQISNIENNKGVCLICLYDNAKAFSGKGAPVKTLIINPVNGHANATFDNVGAGVYAISVIHDANRNNKFDTNFIGIPTEGYGASQNKLPFAAAPKFDANKFEVGANSVTMLPIKLRYLF